MLWDLLSHSPSLTLPTYDRKTIQSTALLVLVRQDFLPVFVVCLHNIHRWFPILILNHLTARSVPMAVGGCVVLGAIMGGYDYAGKLTGQPGISAEEKRKRFFKPDTPIPNMPSTPE